jgi:hypothetical protein
MGIISGIGHLTKLRRYASCSTRPPDCSHRNGCQRGSKSDPKLTFQLEMKRRMICNPAWVNSQLRDMNNNPAYTLSWSPSIKFNRRERTASEVFASLEARSRLFGIRDDLLSLGHGRRGGRLTKSFGQSLQAQVGELDNLERLENYSRTNSKMPDSTLVSLKCLSTPAIQSVSIIIIRVV